MIVVITESTDEILGQRFEVGGVAEAIIRLITSYAERINAIDEGRVDAIIWPEGVVELSLTELIAESAYIGGEDGVRRDERSRRAIQEIQRTGGISNV